MTTPRGEGGGAEVLHLLSDSTGETVAAAASAVLSQFDAKGIERRSHVFVRTPADVDRALAAVEKRPGLVVYTLLDKDLAARLEDGCRRLSAPTVPLLDPFFQAVSDRLGVARTARPGRQHDVTPAYFDRLSAIDYAMTQDDGATPERLRRADVILVGVSRTSKTPTCLYLAVRGVKAANLPLVPHRPPPPGFVQALEAGVPAVGLVASPTRLVQIRNQRLETLGAGKGADYADLERVRDELSEARLLFDRHSLPVIDVTRRSIEETAAAIMALLRNRREGAA